MRRSSGNSHLARRSHRVAPSDIHSDVDLTIASVDAVRHWAYKPYRLNGEPTGVNTTIAVNFNIN